MAPQNEKPAGRHARGSSNIDQLSGNRQEDNSIAAKGQLPVLVAELQKSTDESVRVSIGEYRGHKLIDIRIFAAFTIARTLMPTKKGVSLRVEQLPALVEALKDAEQKARALGLLDGA